MKLSTPCKSCKKDISVKSHASTRIDLEMQKGETFNVNCQGCGTTQKIHINDVEASSNPIFVIITALIAVALTIFFWNTGFIAFATFALPALVWGAQQKSAAAFNLYKRPRR